MRKCVFAGTFDPWTIGHEDVVNKCLAMFDEVVIALLINPEKKELFTLEQRLEMLNCLYGKEQRIKIKAYNGLLIDLLKEENTRFYVRGIRNSVDYGYESLMHYTNAEMYKDLITVFIPTDQNHLHISSSAVRTLIGFNRPVNEYIPEKIAPLIEKYLGEK